MNEDKESEVKANVNQNEETTSIEENTGIQEATCDTPPLHPLVISGFSLTNDDSDNLSKDFDNSSYLPLLTNVPVKLTLDKDKNSIDSVILPSAESASSETYENSIRALGRLSARDIAEPLSNEDIYSKAFKAHEEVFREEEREEGVASLDKKELSQSTKLTQAIKAVLKKANQVKENLDTGIATVYTFRYTISSKADQWKTNSEMNTEFESSSNLN